MTSTRYLADILQIVRLLRMAVRRQMDPSMEQELEKLKNTRRKLMQQLEYRLEKYLQNDHQLEEGTRRQLLNQWTVMIKQNATLQERSGRLENALEFQSFLENVMLQIEELIKLVHKLPAITEYQNPKDLSISETALSARESVAESINIKTNDVNEQEQRIVGGGRAEVQLPGGISPASSRYRQVMQELPKLHDRLIPQTQASAMQLQKSGRMFKGDADADNDNDASVEVQFKTIIIWLLIILAAITILVLAYTNGTNPATVVSESAKSKHAYCWSKEKFNAPCQVKEPESIPIYKTVLNNLMKSVEMLKIKPN